MGTIDFPFASASAEEISARIDEAAAARGVTVSFFAREVLTLFVASVPVEPAVPGEAFGARLEGEDLAARADFQARLLDSFPEAIARLADETQVGGRPPAFQGVITAPDVFHWLTRGAAGLRIDGCPFPSEF